jgi:hypothetical protein
LKCSIRGFASIDRHQNALVHFEIPFQSKDSKEEPIETIPERGAASF